MSRRKGWIWLALALVCAVGAGGLAFFTIEQQAMVAQQSANMAMLPTAVPVPTIKLPVAAHDLDSGSTLTPNDIALKDFPLELVPTNAISSTELLEGQVLIEPIAQGDIFRQRALLGGGSDTVSQQIAQGRTLLALPIIDLMGQSGVIQDGDHVDLLLTVELEDAEGESQGNMTGYTVQNAEVFRVMRGPKTESDPNPRPTGLLLILDPADAVKVKFVKDSGGTIDLALRSPLDQEPFIAPSLNDRDIIRIFEPSAAGGR